jgi:hypothetical protein
VTLSTEPAHAPARVPAVGEALGEDRARLLVHWLRAHGQPVISDAVQTILARHPGDEVHVDLHPVRNLATHRRHEDTEGIDVGTIWLHASGTTTQIGIRARFDGTVTWFWLQGE